MPPQSYVVRGAVDAGGSVPNRPVRPSSGEDGTDYGS